MMNFREFLNDFYNDKTDLGLFTTKNEKDEDVIIEITNNYLKTSTSQNNGWMRINIYHKDKTVEEYYEK